MNGALQSKWHEREIETSIRDSLARHFNLLPETAQVMVNRGVTEVAEAEVFLKPEFSSLIHPGQMLGIEAAVDRIITAINEKQTILVHGDYDIDGITSTALLTRFFRSVGVEPLTYIPNRLTESHGINPGAIEFAQQKGVHLVITCDCGISCSAEISELTELGIDTIVTDHHLVPDSGPPQDAIVVNPSQSDCNFGDQGMAGVGIAYYLTIALRSKLRDQGFFEKGIKEPNMKQYLDLVTLGTIGDLAPLIGQNRVFVRIGLTQLEKTNKMGLRVLLNLCLPADRGMGVQDVAFLIAPKINAAGRLGFAEDAFKLLIEEDPVQSAVLARKLMNYNDERRTIESQILHEAMIQAEHWVKKGASSLVLYGKNWHLGVIGIVAARIVEQFNLPTFLLGSQQDKVRGSGRSVDGVHLVQCLQASSDTLLGFGGHSMAAGLSMTEDKLDAFRQAFDQAVNKLGERDDVQKVLVDGRLDLEKINHRFLGELELLKPFGEGNAEPLFVSEQLKVASIRTMGGKNEHLRVTLSDERGAKIEAVGFNMGGFVADKDKTWNVLYTPEYNYWRGRRSIQARLSAIHTY